MSPQEQAEKEYCQERSRLIFDIGTAVGRACSLDADVSRLRTTCNASLFMRSCLAGQSELAEAEARLGAAWSNAARVRHEAIGAIRNLDEAWRASQK